MIREIIASFFHAVGRASKPLWEPLVRAMLSLARKLRNRLPRNKNIAPVFVPLHLAENPHGEQLLVVQ